MILTPAMEKFVLHWGEMGSAWGINRTVAQIYALLYISPEPLTAEEISDTLTVARSTVSTGLRELQTWGVVRFAHVLGDRRDHFEVMSNVWEMHRAILAEHKRREIDPTLVILREIVAGFAGESDSNAYTQNRLQEMLDFFEIVTRVYTQIEQIPTDTLVRIARLGDRFSQVLGMLAKE